MTRRFTLNHKEYRLNQKVGSFTLNASQKRRQSNLKINNYKSILMSLDSSVSKVTGYGLDDQGLILVRSMAFSLCHCVQIASGSHLVSYPMGTGNLFQGGKDAGASS
jgi:hypothetical protein